MWPGGFLSGFPPDESCYGCAFMGTSSRFLEIVSLPRHSYEVVAGEGVLEELGRRAVDLGLGGQALLLSDATVDALHGQAAAAALESAGIRVARVVVPSGESSKSMEQAAWCCREMIRSGLGRHSFLVALGGGVVGDLAGFVAAIYYRGIPFIQVPTTIVAQVDSSVGGKTGVNAPEGKNLIGAFHHPRLVLADTALLATLPAREFNEGFAEVIKHAAIRDPDMLGDVLALDPAGRGNLAGLIARNVAIKARIVEADPDERSGLRALLNFGHTIGHAIEAEAGYGRMLHGEAISLGLRAALYLSEKHAGLDAGFSRRVLQALAHFDLPLVLGDGFDTDSMLKHLALDKKFSDGAVRFVLLSAPGEAFVSHDLTMDDMRDAIGFLRGKS